MTITKVIGRQIYDSRCRPTVACDIELSDGHWVTASVPSGASTGIHEAIELRDGGTAFDGLGVSRAIENIRDIIAPALIDFPADALQIDKLLLELDKTDNKEMLGANATLAVSIAAFRAHAYAADVDLYHFFASILDRETVQFPTPMINLINGGVHAANKLSFQEYMIVPHGATTFDAAIRNSIEVTNALRKIISSRYGHCPIGDEGGFAPQCKSVIEPLEILMEAIEQAGFDEEMFGIALDVAASQFYDISANHYVVDGKMLSSEQLIDLYVAMADHFPIISIEDGCAEDDIPAWQLLNQKLGQEIAIIGDDLTVTNISRIAKAIETNTAEGLIIKPNQIGTVSQAIDAFLLASSNEWATVASHRSGETIDDFIADFALGVGTDFIKAGGPLRAERMAKYQRLLQIESILTA